MEMWETQPQWEGEESWHPLDGLLRQLRSEVYRISQRNRVLESKLRIVTSTLGLPQRSGVHQRPAATSTSSRFPKGKARRRGAPPKFSDDQARRLRKEYEAGATAKSLARKYEAALPTVLSTLRRAGATLRRGRPKRGRRIHRSAARS